MIDAIWCMNAVGFVKSTSKAFRTTLRSYTDGMEFTIKFIP